MFASPYLQEASLISPQKPRTSHLRGRSSYFIPLRSYLIPISSYAYALATACLISSHSSTEPRSIHYCISRWPALSLPSTTLQECLRQFTYRTPNPNLEPCGSHGQYPSIATCSTDYSGRNSLITAARQTEENADVAHLLKI